MSNTKNNKYNGKPIQTQRNELREVPTQTPAQKLLHLLALVPLGIAIGYIPLIMRYTKYETRLEKEIFFDGEAITSDFQLVYKSYAVIAVMSIMLLVILGKLVIEGREMRFTKAYLPVCGYAVLIILSTAMSEHSDFCLTGSYEQFESTFVLLGYCVIAYYAYLVINETQDICFVVSLMTVGTALMVLVGLSQAFGMDFYSTDLGLHLMLGSYYDTVKDAIRSTFESGRVTMSLYNPNYVGSYSALVAPFFAMLAVATRRKPFKVLYAALAVGVLFCLLGSESRAGFAGTLVSIVICLIVFNKKLIKDWFPVTLAAVLVVGVVVTMNNYTNGALFNKVSSAFSLIDADEYKITDIQTLDDEVVMTYKGEDLHLVFEYDADYGFMIYPIDSSNNMILAELTEQGQLRITDERFEGITLGLVQFADDGNIGFGVTIDGYAWNFYYDGSTYLYHNTYGKYMKMHNTPTCEWLARHGRFASGRGYIWAKALPLLAEYPIIGSGPDTYIFAFPNDDFLSLYNGGYPDTVHTKAHCMYLQIGAQTGTLSMLCVVAFFLMYFIPALIRYIKLKKYDYKSYVGIGILCGTGGYMVVQVINDSSVTFAPIYWGFVGIGLAIDRMLKKEMEVGDVC